MLSPHVKNMGDTSPIPPGFTPLPAIGNMATIYPFFLIHTPKLVKDKFSRGNMPSNLPAKLKSKLYQMHLKNNSVDHSPESFSN